MSCHFCSRTGTYKKVIIYSSNGRPVGIFEGEICQKDEEKLSGKK